jgi:hypothetical protein
MDLIVPTEGIDGVSGQRIYEPLQLEVSDIVRSRGFLRSKYHGYKREKATI